MNYFKATIMLRKMLINSRQKSIMYVIFRSHSVNKGKLQRRHISLMMGSVAKM